jgi:hypothetical protein
MYHGCADWRALYGDEALAERNLDPRPVADEMSVASGDKRRAARLPSAITARGKPGLAAGQ